MRNIYAIAKSLVALLFIILILAALTTCGSTGGQMISSSLLSQLGKTFNAANPLITQMYCADPTAIEHEGRLYVYGTNDHQQYLYNVKGKNTYERIKSLVMMSTDDMVNWTYHGTINTGTIAPWIIASWAPSIVSRVEADGKTHFYLYFSNSGWGVGVLTATSPTGPWIDLLKKSLIDGNTRGLGNGCKAAFDPGVVIDNNGVGWLSFGGSGSYDNADADYFPGGARIVRLGENMISLASDIMEIPAPYHFEANELNYINDTYVYTYNTSWVKRDKWEIQGIASPSACCMSYMTSKTPLDPKSWVYRGNYFRNPGENGMEYSNNHTHLHKYNDQYYLFYHTLVLQKDYGINGGFRSIFADRIEVNEDTLQIPLLKPTYQGVSQIKNVNPYATNLFATFAVSAGLSFEPIDQNGNMSVVAKEPGCWEMIRGVDFDSGATLFAARVKGKGCIEIRIDNINASPAGYMEFSASDWKDQNVSLPDKINGRHDVFFLFGGDSVNVHTWNFIE
jgi:hypothetical protein